MEYVIVEVYLPACGRSFEIRLPLDLNAGMASSLTAKALSRLSEGAYLPSRNSILAWRDGGSLLDARKPLRQCGVRTGSRLLLI